MNLRKRMIVFLLNKGPLDISALLRQANVTVWTSIQDVPVHARQDFTFSALERVNAIILEIGYPSPELNFILAQAIILRIHTLCLYMKGNEPREMLNHLNQPHMTKTLRIKPYTRATIDSSINTFLKGIDRTVHLEDTPKIKFTLRLTPGLEHYLKWLATQKRVNKADYIRNLLRNDAERNEDYHQVVH